MHVEDSLFVYRYVFSIAISESRESLTHFCFVALKFGSFENYENFLRKEIMKQTSALRRSEECFGREGYLRNFEPFPSVPRTFDVAFDQLQVFKNNLNYAFSVIAV